MAKEPVSVRLRDWLWSLRENKRAQLWIMGVVVALLIVALVVIVIVINRNDDARVPESQKVELNISDELSDDEVRARVIDGVEVLVGKENVFPVAVMIENLSTIRPQSGLQGAQVVYEALAEGGITRFLAVYASGTPLNVIAPVRSARSYFVEWAEEYRGMYVHAGGSPQSLQELADNERLVDLNQIGGDHAYFWRDTGAAAPHNLFTSTELLSYALRDKGYEDAKGSFEGWKFTKQAPKADRSEEERHVVIPFSSFSYEVRYEYDREENRYRRTTGGESDVDALTGEQITVRNVVVQFVPTSLAETDSGRLNINTVGEGAVVVFANGIATTGRWKKESRDGRTRFFSEDGTELAFIPGNVWIEVLPDDRTIEYN